MIKKGSLVRLEAKPGKDPELEAFLSSALPLVRLESGTTAWFAVRFRHLEYGIFDVFDDEDSRDVHLRGPVTKALLKQAGTLLASPPKLSKLDVLSAKLPLDGEGAFDTKGLLMTFHAREGYRDEAEKFLQDVEPDVEAESGTTAWFAMRMEDGSYGIFDVFPDSGGRVKHMAGKVPRKLAKKAPWLIGGMPDTSLVSVVAEKRGRQAEGR